MSLRPYDAEACLAYARAVDADPDADPKKGYAACRRATRIDEFEPRHWAALGQAAIRAGMPLKAIKAFRRSAHLRPDCPNLLLDLANGFLTLGQVTEARGVLSAARFRSPKNAQIHRVWERFQFELARRRQERQRSEGSESPVLTFPGRQSEPTAPASPVIIRADHHSRIKPHVFRMFGSRRDPRRAK
jgi:predicted Zn-dependent protease